MSTVTYLRNRVGRVSWVIVQAREGLDESTSDKVHKVQQFVSGQNHTKTKIKFYIKTTTQNLFIF